MQTLSKTNAEQVLAPKAELSGNRYIFLDGLRGVAAIFVFMRHSPFLWGFKLQLVHSHLAVDLFFTLSGFVIAFAYDERLRTGALTVSGFVVVRLIRLYPMYALSALLCIPLYWVIVTSSAAVLPFRMDDVWIAVGCALLFIPNRMNTVELFGVNGPYWSLFFELIANIIYAKTRPFLTDRILKTLCVMFGITTCVGTFYANSLDFGHVSSVTSVVGGLCRAIFGFSLGLLVYRNNSRIAASFIGAVPPWVAIILVATILSLPDLKSYNILIDLTAICFLFPICVAIASKTSRFKFGRLLVFLGTASYPMYVLHAPILTVIDNMSYPYVANMIPVFGILLLTLVVIISVTLEQFYDVPVRRWLNSRRKLSSKHG